MNFNSLIETHPIQISQGINNMKFFAILLTILIQFSCSQYVDTKTEKEKLLQTDIEFAQFSINQGAAEAFKKYLTENALQLPAGRNPIQGRNNIYNIMKENQDDYTLDWSPKYAEVSISGELGYTWGKYILSYIDEDGNKQNSYGKYLNIWKKETDGSWRVSVDMGNKSPNPSD